MQMTTAEFNYLLQNLRDKDCFDKFYHECYPLIKKYSLYLYGRKSFVEDIAQDIFDYLFSHESVPYVQSYRAWLFVLCKNNGNKYIDNNVVALEENAPYTSFTEIYDCGELNEILRILKPEDREIVELKDIIGFSLKEIAEIKGKSYFAVLQQHVRAKNKLKTKMSKKS